jgi:adenylylsulfate kinase
LGVQGFALWFTGLPCSGKTSIASELAKRLRSLGHPVEHLDGDVIRKNLSQDLGFSKKDRTTNIERATFLASILTRQGVATLVSLVSPYRQMREKARFQVKSFAEIYVNCSLEICQKRDTKGLYRLAREGKIKAFTGISDPYEPPVAPEITLQTDQDSLDESVEKVLDFLRTKKWLLPENPFPEDPFLTSAFELAARHHKGQERKGGLPYIVHPVAVAKMLQSSNAPKEAVVAGLLHDALEDTGCELEELITKAGPKAAKIVCEVTDKDKTVLWKQRKKNYLANLKKASKEAMLVACADKIDNLTSLIKDCRVKGEGFPSSFRAQFKEKLANYHNIYKLIHSRYPSCPLLDIYAQKLDEMKKVVSS